MRALRIATAIAMTLVVGGAATGVSFADGKPAPSRQDVQAAQAAVRAKADDVAGVRAQLVLANQRLQASAVAADHAAEAYNGAKWQAQQARVAARAAQRRSDVAATDVERQRQAYGDALVSSYEMAPGLTALNAIAQSDGIATVIDRTTTMHAAEAALDDRYDAFRAAATVADVATGQAQDTRAAAAAAQEKARAARDTDRAAAASALADAQSIAAEKSDLIAQLAHLEHVSVGLAQQRQSALEAAAAAAAAEAAAHQQQLLEQQQAQQQAQQDQSTPAPSDHDNGDNNGGGNGGGSTPAPTPTPTPTPAPTPPPAPASGAQGAIDFARAQIGEPYRWGAAGPDAWDCSGLTMGAWGAAGRSLPHYSVAQYEQSTPVSAAQLQPGDLLFWGSSSDPSSIYHVALYIGGGQMIHAPRTGRPVTQESMYYWTTPNFFARP